MVGLREEGEEENDEEEEENDEEEDEEEEKEGERGRDMRAQGNQGLYYCLLGNTVHDYHSLQTGENITGSSIIFQPANKYTFFLAMTF